VASAAGELFRDGHFGSAVFEAFKAVEARVRRETSSRLTGRRLMAEAFSEQEPRLRVAGAPEAADLDVQEGFKLIFMGAMQAIRNQGAHGFPALSRERALEHLAFASLLMHEIDDATPSGVDKGVEMGPARPADVVTWKAPPEVVGSGASPRRRGQGGEKA
jgi:uncharacterized protein (TIGR02391 family)